MPALDKKRLETYLSSVYKKDVKISSINEIGKEEGTGLKGFGYGIPYRISCSVDEEIKDLVLETMAPNSFGHDHFSDRAQCLIWDHSTFNRLPDHVRSIDVGAFTPDGRIISCGEAEEFFIITEFVAGEGYYLDLKRILSNRKHEIQDEERTKALAQYLARIHRVRKDAPHLYTRRIRDLIGHGECIMGLIDNYPEVDSVITRKRLQSIEELCVRWRWKIKDMGHRLCQIHGDFHPWNILFRKGTDYTILDRARGEWGEPADDIATLAINYIFFSLQHDGRLKGPFERLHSLFWETYLHQTGDAEMQKVIQPFLAWRGLVIANPLWYPTLHIEIREKLFHFIEHVLMAEEFNPERVNEYMEDLL